MKQAPAVLNSAAESQCLSSQLQCHLNARYGSPAAPDLQLPCEAAVEVLSLLVSHRSVRSYADTPVNETVLPALVAAAQSAATSSNLQAWSLVAVADAGRKARLAELAGDQAHIRECPLFLVWLADLSRLERVAQREGCQAGALSFLELYSLALVDAALAAQNAVIAAEALGLGTVFIGGLRNQPERVSEELHLPKRSFAVFGLCVGYPKPGHQSAIKPRLPPTSILHYETYSAPEEDKQVAGYDRELASFQERQGMPVLGWSKQVSKRVAGEKSLSGRDRLKQALMHLGFELE